MKKLIFLITNALILSAIILKGFSGVTNQSEGFSPVQPLEDQAIERAQISEGTHTLFLFISQTLDLAYQLREARITLTNEAEANDLIINPSSENWDDEDLSGQELPVVESQIAIEPSLDEGHVTRLAMEDDYYSQLTDTSVPNACGPTALMMALEYFELEDSLATLIQKLQFSPAEGGYDPSCSANPVCTSPGALAKVAHEEYGLVVDAHDGWTFDEIKESISAGQPIIADIVWRLAEEGLGHFVVIYGIDPEGETIFYHDPYDGAEREASWEAFSLAWDGPVDRGDPLQPQGHAFWGMSLSAQ